MKFEHPSTLSGNIKRIASLSWPMMVGQMAVVGNGVIDTAMTSRFSATDLAALSIGISIYVSIFVGLNGILQSISPVVGQLFGARKFKQIGAEIKQGVWLGLFLACIGCLILLFPNGLLSIAQASPTLNDKAAQYLQILAIALPATLGFRIYGALNNAVGRPKMVMAIQLAALAIKIPLNTLFIFGGLGIPAMGGPGCAAATAVNAWLMLLTGWLMLKHVKYYDVFALFGSGFVKPNWKALRSLLNLGIPMGLSYLIEVTAFAFMALFIARLGEVAVSGHQLTANFGTILYMLPLSIASATGTLVAQAIGAKQMQAARVTGNAGIILAAMLAVPIGITIWFSRGLILHAYTSNPLIIAAALPLFTFISVYQIFDAIQVTTAFILRAYKIAIVPTILYAFALWGCGLGGGFIMGLDPYHISPAFLHGAAGFWMANSTSLAIVAFSLWYYLRIVQKRFPTPAMWRRNVKFERPDISP
ncbi:MATE family efflux transporter [Undibacterium sp. CY18W]|uniref:Multidrug-efflux transporter n=1 Tax=Undibacterium hunanense TaxID=2762292 RepID=A0ABR6ZUC5_9BURK|nr:MATE family efflux transporter [Undibacterium hunanense]MBC3919229.1 MATE family efflux transporter [Undibacterium hunanense]